MANRRLELPEGWTSDDDWYPGCTVIKGGQDGGFATIHWERRAFGLGASPPWPSGDPSPYKGRGWAQQIVTDAVEALQKAMGPVSAGA